MVLRDRNHPAYYVGIGNEIPEQKSEDGWTSQAVERFFFTRRSHPADNFRFQRLVRRHPQ